MPGGLSNIWQRPESIPQYYPLVHSVFWLEYRWWGLDPFGYHLLNILLHAFNAFLVLLLLRKLSVPGAWLAALAFALHPVMVESVAWVTELKNVLSAFFYLWSLFFYLGSASKDGPFRYGRYLLSFILFLCALLSKTVTSTLPLAILIISWWKNGRIGRREALFLLPWFAAGAGFGLMTVWLEKHQVMAVGSEWSLSIAQRVLVAGRAFWFYLEKLFWPARLTFIYPRWDPDIRHLSNYLWPLSAAALFAALYLLRKRTGRGLLAGLLFFLAALFPALGFFNVYPFRYSFMADHFQYLAGLGIIVAVIGGIASWVKKHRPEYQKKAALSASLLVTVLAGLTFAQTGIYRDLPTLWRDTVKKNPDCWMAYNNLGYYHLAQGRPDSAESCFLKAVTIDPSGTDQLNNLGLIYMNQGRLPESVRFFRAAALADPSMFTVRYNLGLAYLQMDSLPQAGDQLKRALEVNSSSAEACANLGLVYWRQRKISVAELLFTRAVVLNPSLFPARLNLGLVYQEQGKPELAERQFLEALKADPGFSDALYSLAQLYLEQGRYREARAGFGKLLQKHPGDSMVAAQLKKAEAGMKRLSPGF